MPEQPVVARCCRLSVFFGGDDEPFAGEGGYVDPGSEREGFQVQFRVVWDGDHVGSAEFERAAVFSGDPFGFALRRLSVESVSAGVDDRCAAVVVHEPCAYEFVRVESAGG